MLPVTNRYIALIQSIIRAGNEHRSNRQLQHGLKNDRVKFYYNYLQRRTQCELILCLIALLVQREACPSKAASLAPSSRLFAACAGRDRYGDDLTSIESSSTRTVVRRTTGWKWMVVFGSFGAHFVADGVLFSFGILMHIIKDDLKIELHTVGIIASLFASLPLFLAPLSSALVNKVGCRMIIMSGGLICSLGLLFASLLGNFLGAVLGIGVACGVGLSFVYVPGVVIVAHYFDENRAIATAMAVSGTGLGNAVVAQLIHRLNNYYGDWRDTTLILSGVMFTIVGFGALFRPVEFSFCQKARTNHQTIHDHRLPPTCMTPEEKFEWFISRMAKQRTSRQGHLSASMSVSHVETIDSYSLNDITELDDECFDLVMPMSRSPHLLKRPIMKKQAVGEVNTSLHAFDRFLSLPPEKQEKQLLEVYKQPISRKDIFYRGNVPLKSSNSTRTSCPNLIQSYVYEESAGSISENDDHTSENHSHSIHQRRQVFYHKGLSFYHTLQRMLGLEVFRDYRYGVFFISQFLFYLFYDLIYLFPVDYGETVIGYSKKQMTLLVTVLGCGQFFGQILFGFLANYSPIDELILYDVGAILCGLTSLLIPFIVHSYTLLLLTILLFGVSISANYALTSVILANICGLELLTSAYGLILLGQGLSSLIGPILGGWIAEQYGYRASLIVAGIFMGLSGFVTFLIPVIQRFRSKKELSPDANTMSDSIG